jgi:hypothetical protein
MSDQPPRKKSGTTAKARAASASSRPRAEAPPQAAPAETGPTTPLNPAPGTHPDGAGPSSGSVPVHDAAEALRQQPTAPPADAVPGHAAAGQRPSGQGSSGQAPAQGAMPRPDAAAAQHPQPGYPPQQDAGQYPPQQDTAQHPPQQSAAQYPPQQDTTPYPPQPGAMPSQQGPEYPQGGGYAPGAVSPGPGYPPTPPPMLYDAYGRPVAPAPPATLSITSMILSISGFLLLSIGIGLFASIAGVITGHIARKREPHARGFWLTGIIAGWIGVGLAVLVLLAIIVAFLVAGAAFLPFLSELGTGDIDPGSLS